MAPDSNEPPRRYNVDRLMNRLLQQGINVGIGPRDCFFVRAERGDPAMQQHVAIDAGRVHIIHKPHNCETRHQLRRVVGKDEELPLLVEYRADPIATFAIVYRRISANEAKIVHVHFFSASRLRVETCQAMLRVYGLQDVEALFAR